MNILLITVRADFGGGPEHVYQLCNGVKEYDIDYYMACPKEKPYYDLYSEIIGEDKITIIPHRSFSIIGFIKLLRFIKKNNISVVHSHGKGAGIYSRMLSFYMSKLKCVHTFHGLHIGKYNMFTLKTYRIYEKIMSRYTNKVIAVSNSEKSSIIDFLNLKKDKIKVIENGVFIPNKNEIRNEESNKIIVVTRFDYQKNTELLIPIAQELINYRIPFKFTLLGEGEGKVKLMDSIKKNNLEEYFEILGAVSNPRDYFKDACCFLSTSRWEGLPLAPLEAMSEGIPLVVTSVTGHTDIVKQGYNGYLYPLDGEIKAAEYLQKILTNSELLSTLSKNSKEYVMNRFSVGIMCRQTYDLYFEYDKLK
jgi:glycosyltransferase involved in cell wall biosynthesis